MRGFAASALEDKMTLDELKLFIRELVKIPVSLFLLNNENNMYYQTWILDI